MKKLSIILFLTIISFTSFGSNLKFEKKEKVVEKHNYNKYMTSFESQGQKGRKTKDGRYKRKKGFMWGLFKSKKECDCPKH